MLRTNMLRSVMATSDAAAPAPAGKPAVVEKKPVRFLGLFARVPRLVACARTTRERAHLQRARANEGRINPPSLQYYSASLS